MEDFTRRRVDVPRDRRGNALVAHRVTGLVGVGILLILLMMGIMSRMIPSTALTSAIPGIADRGAFMSINSSLQQLAGGVAALISGLIVTQKTKTSPIEHFDILGYVVAGVIICCIFFVYRMYVYVQAKKQQPGATL